jgi:hypothetical protein
MPRKLLTALGVVAATVLLLGGPASAGGVFTQSDPKDAPVAKGDIRAVRVSQAGSSLLVRLRTEKPLNLDTAPAWQNEGTRSVIRIYLDTTDGSTGAEAQITIRNDEGFLVAQFFNFVAPSPAEGGCLPVLTQPQLTMIQVSIDIGCFPIPDHAAAYATYRLDQGGDGTQDSFDRAPNVGFTTRPVPIQL